MAAERLVARAIRLGDSCGTGESRARYSVMRACRPTSSLLERVTFDDDAGVLTVTLTGERRYAYFGVSAALYRELCGAASPGAFYNRRIRGRFACREVWPRRRFRPAEA